MPLIGMKRAIRNNNPIENNTTLEINPTVIKPENTGVELKLAEGASMFVNVGNCQNQGARNYQEDSFGYSNIIDSALVTKKGLLAILSDGMGGLANGKEVSDYVVRAAISLFDNIDVQYPIHLQMKAIIDSINKNVCDQYGAGTSSNAGATLVFAYIFKNRIYWATVGDSRLYCLRDGNMFQMNEDHDYKNELFREYLHDNYRLEDVEMNPQKDCLTSFIGKVDYPYVDCSLRGFKIRPNDIFVLCSDGIYNGVSLETMQEIIIGHDAQSASELIVDEVVKSRFPGQDNMTVMVIKCSK